MLQIFWLSTYSISIYKGVSDKNNIGEAPCSAVMLMNVAIFLELEARAKQERVYAPLATGCGYGIYSYASVAGFMTS